MALLTKKINKDKKTDVVVAVPVKTTVIIKSRVTEKATVLGMQNIYILNVTNNATKRDLSRIISSEFKVTPVKIAMVQVPEKVKRNGRTGRISTKAGSKKAYVYLKKGDTMLIK